MHLNSKFWLKFSLLNLLIVALIGLLMRYKIGFEFPFFDQKHLQHSHSHFAFSGWISHTLMVLMIVFLEKKKVLLQAQDDNRENGAIQIRFPEYPIRTRLHSPVQRFRRPRQKTHRRCAERLYRL